MSLQNVTEGEGSQRKCCLHTSDLLKEALACFPAPPPPTPTVDDIVVPADTKYACISVYCAQENRPHLVRETAVAEPLKEFKNVDDNTPQAPYTAWTLLLDLCRVLQVSAVVAALVAYHLVYFYVQLLYMTFRTVIYFNNVDGPMKITIGVIAATSLLVAFSLFMKIERLFCYH